MEETPPTTNPDFEGTSFGRTRHPPTFATLDQRTNIGQLIKIGRTNTSEVGLFVDNPKKLGKAGKVGQVSNASALVDLPFTINSLETGEYVEKSARLERIPFSRCLSYFVVNFCPRFSLLWSRTFNFNFHVFRVVGVQARRGKDSFSKVIALKVETTTTLKPKQQ